MGPALHFVPGSSWVPSHPSIMPTLSPASAPYESELGKTHAVQLDGQPALSGAGVASRGRGKRCIRAATARRCVSLLACADGRSDMNRRGNIAGSSRRCRGAATIRDARFQSTDALQQGANKKHTVRKQPGRWLHTDTPYFKYCKNYLRSKDRKKAVSVLLQNSTCNTASKRAAARSASLSRPKTRSAAATRPRTASKRAFRSAGGMAAFYDLCRVGRWAGVWVRRGNCLRPSPCVRESLHVT